MNRIGLWFIYNKEKKPYWTTVDKVYQIIKLDNMKKIILTLAVCSLLFLASCKKEECNCGLILDDNAADYSILIRNECTGNERWFTLSRGDWMNAHPGNNWCITNIDSW